MSAPALAEPRLFLQAQIRWHPLEIAFWLATLAPFVVFPNYLQLASQIVAAFVKGLSAEE